MLWLRKPSLPIFLVLVLLLSSANGRSASEQLRFDQHGNEATKLHPGAQKQQAQVPLPIPHSTQAALPKSIEVLNQQTKPETEQAHAYREGWHSPSVLVQIVLAGVGIAYTIVALLQWYAIRKQVKLATVSLKINRIAADAAKMAAEAAKQSAELAQTQLTQAERAWIAFEVTGLKGIEHVTDRIRKLHPSLREPENSPTVEIVILRLEYRFNNCGRTPARLVAGSIDFVCNKPSDLSVPRYRDMRPLESLLPPGPASTLSIDIKMFPPRFEQFVTGSEALIVFGFIRYYDIVAIGDKALHESRFRMECRFPGYVLGNEGQVIIHEPLCFAYAGPEAYNRHT